MSASLVRRAATSAVSSSAASSAETKTVQYPYFVARQITSQRLPVYNEFRAGTKATTLIRNVDGNAGALRNDLLGSLFHSAKRPPKILIRHGKHVEIQGAWREPVAQWLLSRGF